MQTVIVILVVIASALYAAARLLPGEVVERVLQRVETAFPAFATALRHFAGRPRGAPGAGAAGVCSSCSAAATHAPSQPPPAAMRSPKAR